MDLSKQVDDQLVTSHEAARGTARCNNDFGFLRPFGEPFIIVWTYRVLGRLQPPGICGPIRKEEFAKVIPP